MWSNYNTCSTVDLLTLLGFSFFFKIPPVWGTSSKKKNVKSKKSTFYSDSESGSGSESESGKEVYSLYSYIVFVLSLSSVLATPESAMFWWLLLKKSNYYRNSSPNITFRLLLTGLF